MRALILSALISLSAAAPVTVQQGRDEGQFTIAVDVDLVVFNVTVTDGKGRHVVGLGQKDFSIHEDGRREVITVFQAEDAPASVGLIIDNSGSMHAKHLDVVNSAVSFVGVSNPHDEIFIVNFNEKVYLAFPEFAAFAGDPDRLRSTLLGKAPDGLTALYDAVATGLDHLTASTRDRKALVVLSDGGDNASRRSLNDVIQMAQRSSATIYTIGIYDVNDMDQNPGVLRKIADLTGGQAYFPKVSRDLQRIWGEIAGAIRSQYTIGYIASGRRPDDVFRKVKVTALDHEGKSLKVQTRAGYVAPDSKTKQKQKQK